MDSTNQSRSPEEITKLGEQIYFERKEELEREHNGEYAVIDVDSKESFVNNDLMTAVNQAKEKYPDKLFFIVQIGTLQKPSINLKRESHGLLF